MSIALNEHETLQSVIPSTGYAIIDYYADWCGPCKSIAPILETIEKERTDVKVIKVNIDTLADLAMTNGISSIPTLQYYKDGQKIGQSIGAIPKPRILENLK